MHSLEDFASESGSSSSAGPAEDCVWVRVQVRVWATVGSDADVQLEWVRNPMVSLGTLF